MTEDRNGRGSEEGFRDCRTVFGMIGLGTIGRLLFSRALIALTIGLSTAGCASFPLFGSKTAKFEQADEKNPAVEILAFWQSSEGPGPQGVPIRGFGGQVYFFTQGKETPVTVDGSVRVYLFDDHGTPQEQSQPVAMFEFDAAHWKTGAHKSALGPAYSVFVPYPRNDFHQTTCSLRIRFQPTAGPPIYSPPATVILAGPTAKAEKADEANIQPPKPQQQAQWSRNGGGASMTTSVSYPPFRVPNSRNVMAVNGTDADARMSLGNEIPAPDNSRVQTADYTDDASASPSSRFRLQSAQSDSSDRDGE